MILNVIYSNIRMILKSEMEHRANVWAYIFVQLASFAMLIVFFELVFSNVTQVSGWTKLQVQLLAALAQVIELGYSATLKKGVLILDKLVRVGKFDYYLLKPIDSQIQLAYSSLDFKPIFGMIAPIVWIIYCCNELCITINPYVFLVMLIMVVSCVLIRYSFALSAAALSFLLVKVSAIQSLQSSLFRQSKYPESMLKGWKRVLFVYILPIGLIANGPLEALRHGGYTDVTLYIILYAILAIISSRTIYMYMIKWYTSASS